MAAGGFAGDSTFNAEAAGAMSSLMTLASAAIIIPAVYVAFDSRQNHELLDSVLILSRGTSIVLLVLYIVYLDFSLMTHTRLFEECKDEVEAAASSNDKKPVKLSPQVALLTLVVVTTLIAVCSEFIVDTLDEIAQHLNINKEFIGLIILPAVENAAEYITAIGAAAKNNMNFAVNVAVGSSLSDIPHGNAVPGNTRLDHRTANEHILRAILRHRLLPVGLGGWHAGLEGAMLVGM